MGSLEDNSSGGFLAYRSSKTALNKAMTIVARHVQTDRLNTFVREAGDPAAPVLLLVHGNVSSSVFFEELMADLAADFDLGLPLDEDDDTRYA